jgi:uncharacterized protein DUF3866
MLKLRRGEVTSIDEPGGPVARITVRVGDEQRAAIAYPDLTGPLEAGDEVVVNVESQDLGLGSGGFDIVYVNLSRGFGEGAEGGAHVMKLNYTPLQHAVVPVEEGLDDLPRELGMPVAVLGLHGQIAPMAFAAARGAPDARIAFVQTAGGALPGQLSDVVRALRSQGLLADHVTVAPCFGGEREAITLEGALHAGAESLGWDAAVVGPGPGILGSASALGNGGLEALHSAHSALALGCPVTLAPRMSSGDPRRRHRGLSHHTATVLELLMRPVEVPLASGVSATAGAELASAAKAGAHRLVETDVENVVPTYLESGLPSSTMGRSFEQDEDFFRSALATGAELARKVVARGR